jgi:RNA polymerase sigma-70 factor, ECF subfamily
MLSNPAVSATMPTADQPLGALDDKALVDAAQSGNSFAFIELCRRHSNRLIRRINRITKNWEDAEDALQDSLLNAYRNLGRFENRCAFSSWLTTIGINSALMLLRRKRITVVSLDDSYDFFEMSDSVCSWHRGVDPESHYGRQEQHSRLRTAIHGLPYLLRTVTELRIDHEYSVGEIARALQISQSAVKSRLARARCRLREALAGMSPELDSQRRSSGMLFRPTQLPLEAEGSSCRLDAAA